MWHHQIKLRRWERTVLQQKDFVWVISQPGRDDWGMLWTIVSQEGTGSRSLRLQSLTSIRVERNMKFHSASVSETITIMTAVGGKVHSSFIFTYRNLLRNTLSNAYKFFVSSKCHLQSELKLHFLVLFFSLLFWHQQWHQDSGHTGQLSGESVCCCKKQDMAAKLSDWETMSPTELLLVWDKHVCPPQGSCIAPPPSMSCINTDSDWRDSATISVKYNPL